MLNQIDYGSLPRYTSHKVVCAAKINAIDFNERLDLAPHGVVEVGRAWVAHRKPEVGGYFVVYEDGYTSYSPAAAFEKGYTVVDGPRVIDAGHRYRLGGAQVLQFLKKEREVLGERNSGAAVLGEFVTTAEGTTTEQVIEVLLDRLRTMQAAVPCMENERAIMALVDSLFWLGQRTRNRQARGVEGSPNA